VLCGECKVMGHTPMYTWVCVSGKCLINCTVKNELYLIKKMGQQITSNIFNQFNKLELSNNYSN